jgi:PLP dependent protein
MPDLVSSIRERYQRTLNTIADAARRAGREPESVRLVVVTKTQPIEVVEAAIQAGAKILGENYPEEAVEKIMQLKPQTGVEWHILGHVQSRKARLVAEHFALFQTLDSVKLAERVNRFAAELKRVLPVLLEFKVGDEASKSGWPAADDTRWTDLLNDVQAITSLEHLKVLGLMTMPPLSTDPQAARPYFQRLRRLRDFLSKRLPQAEWIELSMGTSADYVVAVEEGATLVRVGQAILGPRPAGGE